MRMLKRENIIRVESCCLNPERENCTRESQDKKSKVRIRKKLRSKRQRGCLRGVCGSGDGEKVGACFIKGNQRVKDDSETFKCK